MGARWTSITLLVAALLTRTLCLLQDPLQSLEPVEEGKPVLREFSDHAEYKAPAVTEGSKETPSTTESRELPPSPVVVRQETSDSEAAATEKKPSVPKKGVLPKKSSVVPKKEVHFTPSVVAKKGADPESSTPSVSPRKGVELPPGSLVHDILLVSSENMNNTLPDDDSKTKVNARMNETQDEAVSGSVKETKEGVSDVPEPQLVQNGKLSDALGLARGNSSPPSPPLASGPSPVVPLESESILHAGHVKPATADDINGGGGGGGGQVSYAPIFVIVALVVLLVVVVAVGYHRLKDIWMRRHYDYVDFLIDGMYE